MEFHVQSHSFELHASNSKLETVTTFMHELSIALSMIDLATEEAQRHAGARVNALHLKLGPLSGVVKEALLFSYEVATTDTPLAGSRLIIEDVPVVIYCAECEAEQVLETIQRFSCPACGTLSSAVVRGRELEFVALELEEPEPALVL